MATSVPIISGVAGGVFVILASVAVAVGLRVGVGVAVGALVTAAGVTVVETVAMEGASAVVGMGGSTVPSTAGVAHAANGSAAISTSSPTRIIAPALHRASMT